MGMREKLIELIRKADKEDHETRTQDEHYTFMADFLIASGVTIQKWIPSWDYPKEVDFYNCYYKIPDGNLWRVGMCYWNGTNWIQIGFMPIAVQVMFYMPLPKSPKGE